MLADRLGDRLADKSFRRLSASLYSVDTQRDVPLLEDMADIFTNSILYLLRYFFSISFLLFIEIY